MKWTFTKLIKIGTVEISIENIITFCTLKKTFKYQLM